MLGLEALTQYSLGMAAARTVRDLALEAGADLEDALVTLWLAGLESIEDGNSSITPSQEDAARAALGLPTRQELKSLSYWARRFDESSDELGAWLTSKGFKVTSRSTAVPRGAVKALRRRLAERPSTPGAAPSPAIGTIRKRRGPAPAWRVVGNVRQVFVPDESEVEAIHRELFEDLRGTSDPIHTPGTRSPDLLAMACSRPHTAWGEHPKYPTPEMAASALAHSLIHDHPFHNGNKRTAMIAYLVTLERNELTLTCTQDELFRFILLVAKHGLVDGEEDYLADHEVLAMAEWTKNNTRRRQRGDRPLKWWKLEKILLKMGCTVEYQGTKVAIKRRITTRGWLGIRTRNRTLRHYMAYGGDGREISVPKMRDLRRKLELDEDHGVDAGYFYENAATTAGDLIDYYRTILERLAKL